MVDGSSVLMQMMWGFRATGMWSDERGTNMLDTGAPYYDTYETADGKYVAVGAIEPQFYARAAGRARARSAPTLPDQNDMARWPELREPLHRGVRRPRPRPLGQGLRRHRRLRDAGAELRRGGDRTAHHRARHLLPRRRQPAARRPRRGSPAACRRRRRRPACPAPTPKPSSATGYSPNQPVGRAVASAVDSSERECIRADQRRRSSRHRRCVRPGPGDHQTTARRRRLRGRHRPPRGRGTGPSSASA